MIVTNDAHPPLQTNSYKFKNHFSNNNNNISKGSQPLSGSGSKYLVDKVESPIIGHDNLAFDASGIFSQDGDLFNPTSESHFCDPGYGSDRSEGSEGSESSEEEDEEIEKPFPSILSSREEQRTLVLNRPADGLSAVEYVMSVCPFINEANTFDVTVIKNLRGLGLAVTGGIECDTQWPGLIRIKKLYPQTPAWLCGQLKVDDFLLEVDHKSLSGLTSHEALEMLRTAGTEVHLVVSRSAQGIQEGSDCSPEREVNPGVVGGLSAPQAVPFDYNLSPSPSFSTYGEFEVQLTKVAGSLGFTLRKQDNSILGHTIRSLVKEPAISDGRIRPGDKLLSVNGTDMCGLSHEEAVKFLRTCPETVVIRLYRDALQTPVSPASPAEPDFFSKPKQLRKEARDMLSDLAFRKQSPSLSGSANGDRPGTPRRRRLQKTPSPDVKTVSADRWESLVKEAENDSLAKRLHESGISPRNDIGDRNDSLTMSSSSHSGTLVSRNSSNSSSITESRPQRPTYLDLNTPKSSSRKSQFTPPHEDGVDYLSPFNHPYTTTSEESESQFSESLQQMEINSAPQSSTQSDNNYFSHLQQGYHSVNLGALPSHGKQRLTNTASDHELSSHLNDDFSEKNSTLLKWKGVVFTPEDDEEDDEEEQSDPPPYTPLGNEGSSSFSKQNSKILKIEMTRGWNSRLGFSIQPQDGKTTIVAIYSDSVAAKDGRLKVGDQLLEVNDVDVSAWQTDEVIDLLRKTRGKIVLKVLQET